MSRMLDALKRLEAADLLSAPNKVEERGAKVTEPPAGAATAELESPATVVPPASSIACDEAPFEPNFAPLPAWEEAGAFDRSLSYPVDGAFDDARAKPAESRSPSELAANQVDDDRSAVDEISQHTAAPTAPEFDEPSTTDSWSSSLAAAEQWTERALLDEVPTSEFDAAAAVAEYEDDDDRELDTEIDYEDAAPFGDEPAARSAVETTTVDAADSEDASSGDFSESLIATDAPAEQLEPFALGTEKTADISSLAYSTENAHEDLTGENIATDANLDEPHPATSNVVAHPSSVEESADVQFEAIEALSVTERDEHGAESADAADSAAEMRKDAVLASDGLFEWEDLFPNAALDAPGDQEATQEHDAAAEEPESAAESDSSVGAHDLETDATGGDDGAESDDSIAEFETPADGEANTDAADGDATPRAEDDEQFDPQAAGHDTDFSDDQEAQSERRFDAGRADESSAPADIGSTDSEVADQHDGLTPPEQELTDDVRKAEHADGDYTEAASSAIEKDEESAADDGPDVENNGSAAPLYSVAAAPSDWTAQSEEPTSGDVDHATDIDFSQPLALSHADAPVEFDRPDDLPAVHEEIASLSEDRTDETFGSIREVAPADEESATTGNDVDGNEVDAPDCDAASDLSAAEEPDEAIPDAALDREFASPDDAKEPGDLPADESQDDTAELAQNETDISPAEGDAQELADSVPKDDATSDPADDAPAISAAEQAALADLSDETLAQHYAEFGERILSDLGKTTRPAAAIASAEHQPHVTETTLRTAMSLAQSGRQVLIVDAALEDKQLTSGLGLTAETGLTEALKGRVEWQHAVRATGTPGLCVLPAGRLAPPQLFKGDKRLSGLLTELSSQWEFVLIDAGSCSDSAAPFVLAAVRNVYLLVRLGETQADSAALAIAAIEGTGANLRGCVATNAQ